MKESIHGLKVDNDVREAIIKMMKMKRVIAWILFFVSLALVVWAIVFLLMRWPGGYVMYLTLPVSAVLLAVAITTLSATSTMNKALKMNNQSAFDEAMSKWNKRSLVTFVGYLIVILLILFLMVIQFL